MVFYVSLKERQTYGNPGVYRVRQNLAILSLKLHLWLLRNFSNTVALTFELYFLAKA